MFGLIQAGDYYKWQKRRSSHSIPIDLKVLVVGAGSVGKRHLVNTLGLGITHVAVVDTREDRRKEVKDHFGNLSVFANEADAYKTMTYDAVIIANPPAYHLESAQNALAHGAHVLIEKSISHSSEGVAEFLAEAKRKNKKVGVLYMYRFFDTIKKVKELVESGSLGHVYAAQITFSEYLPDWHFWEKPEEWYVSKKSEGGSELLDENHTVDFARWFFGDIDSVSGHVTRAANVTIDADDFAAFTLFHKNGVVTEIHQDAFGRKPRKDMCIMGEKGTVFWDSYMGRNCVEWYSAETKKTEIFPGRVSRDDAFFEHLKDFFESIALNREPAVTGDDGLQALKACEAAIISSESHRREQV